MDRTLKPEELKTLLQTRKDVVVFDVRRPLSTSCLSRHSHVPVHHKHDYHADNQKVSGSMWLDPERDAQRCTALPHDKQVVIYCARGGSVSNSVLDVLLGKGFKACFIEGGIEAWKAAGGATTAKQP